MSAPAGWYPDPDPNARRGSSRYWDGGAWTAHVRNEGDQPPPQQPSSYPAHDPYGPQAPTYADHPDAASGPRTHTADGEPLAGYGRRVVAYLLDALLLSVVVVLVTLPFIQDVVDTYERFLDEALAAARTGAEPPGQTEILEQAGGSLAAITLISLGLGLAYYCGFWKWRAATPGKLAMGLRIRRWDAAGPLRWSTVGLRWLGLNLGALVSVVPLVGCLGAVWPFADLLWPLWDPRRQALHDKIAGTVVVRVR